MCIINAVGPQWASCDDNHKLSCLEDLYLTIRKVLDTSEKEKIKSVAIPPISSGIFGVPKELCAPMYVQAITDFDFMKKKYPQEVHIVDLSDEVLDLTCKAYQSFTEDPKNIRPVAILKNYEIFTKEIITKQTKSSDTYPEQNPCRLFKNDGEKAIFEMESGVEIFIYRDDLVMLRGIGTLVSAENSAFTGNGALAKSILQHAGPSYVKHHNQVRRDLKDKRLAKNTLRTLDAGKLDYRYVIHAVVNRFAEDVDRKEDELLDLKMITFKVLTHGDFLCTCGKKSKNLEKIAMPLLGAVKFHLGAKIHGLGLGKASS
uniref:Poly [ADP-ribose] polymerase 14 n=1 Tax=Magallana gigas TaxID=29159 RepID=K1QM36_MAGGI